MFISKQWLAKYVPEIMSVEDSEIREKLTQVLAEVEGYTNFGEQLSNLVAGKIIEVHKHPNADKLHLCKVDIGEKEARQIVCGAPNVVEGMLVVVCLPGGSVYDEKGKRAEIKVSKIRDIESFGMLCSERELGLSAAHDGILALDGAVKPGTDVDALIRDTIFEIENKSLTHRGDCFSHRGIAREIAAIWNFEYAEPVFDFQFVKSEDLPLTIDIKTDNCSKFAAASIKGITVKESPFWLRLALIKIGERPRNNVVDITNFLMFDLGQPLHAYDYKQVAGGTLIARDANKDEKITAINHKEYSMAGGEILICDKEKPLGIAGIIGGASSEINISTTDIIIEAAVFKPTLIVKSSRNLGVRTEAGVRFGKGIDGNSTVNVLQQAVDFLCREADGELGSDLIDSNPAVLPSHIVELDLQQVNRLMGAAVTAAEIIDILESLQLKVLNKTSVDTLNAPVTMYQSINVEVPNYRTDIKIAEDLIEEVARIYGYQRIEPKLPTTTYKAAQVPVFTRVKRKVNSTMQKLGFHEVINYSFISKEVAKQYELDPKNLLEIKNAISPELNFVRNTLVPGLVESALANYYYRSTLNLYEIGRKADNARLDPDKLPWQPWMLAAVIGKDIASDQIRAEFLTFKGSLEALLLQLGIPAADIEWLDFNPNSMDIPVIHKLAPGKISVLAVKGDPVGYVGEIQRSLIIGKVSSANYRVFAAEVFLDILIDKKVIDTTVFTNPSSYPATSRDISFFLGNRVEIGKVIKTLVEKLNTSDKVQVQIDLLDEFTKNEQRSATLHIIITPFEKTLTDKETNEFVVKATTILTETFDAEIR